MRPFFESLDEILLHSGDPHVPSSGVETKPHQLTTKELADEL